MRLDEYEWSRNPRGMHNESVFRIYPDRYRQIKAGWVKLVSHDYEYVDNIPDLLASGITPIVRIYRAQSCGQPADADAYASIQRYVNAGVRWFELWNEPNLGNEWPSFLEPGLDPENIDVYIAPMMNHWIEWAERVIQMGGYPGFIALGPGAVRRHAATIWLRNMMAYLRGAYYSRFRAILASGLWFADHPYIYNHFYQELPGGGPLSARQPEQQNASEGGWHFNYPYDAICQSDDPGRSVWGGTPSTPYGDPVGLGALGGAFMDLLREYFGGGVVPVIGTEGGIWPWPGPGDAPLIADARYPGVTWRSHAEAMTAMFDWIASPAAPPWLFGVTLWKEDYYWNTPNGTAPTVDRLAATGAPFKTVPPLDTGGSIWPGPGGAAAEPEVPEGPGPIHGGPDYHFWLLSPDLPPDWLFQSGLPYWERFKPVLLHQPELIQRMPYNQSLAVTVIASPAQAPAMNAAIRDRWPNIWYDLVVVESATALADVLAQRVAAGRRFG